MAIFIPADLSCLVSSEVCKQGEIRHLRPAGLALSIFKEKPAALRPGWDLKLAQDPEGTKFCLQPWFLAIMVFGRIYVYYFFKVTSK